MAQQRLTPGTFGIKAAAFALGFAAMPASANVVWDFLEEGISCAQPTCSLPAQPHVLAELILPGPDSTGSISWRMGGLPADHRLAPPPVHTGDDFIFLLEGYIGYLDPQNLLGPPFSPYAISSYDISWKEVAGQLVSVFIDMNTFSTNAQLTLTGGRIASDYKIGGCEINTCDVTGHWEDPPDNFPQLLQTPEPGSVGLLTVALGMLGWRRRCSKS